MLNPARFDIWDLLAVAASVFLLAYFVMRCVLGPLGYDEVYFSHTLWLTLQGNRQYVNFYSSHLPTYFVLLAKFLPSSGPLDLNFIWGVRAIGLLVLAAYVLLLSKIERERWVRLLPLLLVFVVVGRMIEIRTDTFGLLLFNGAWAILLAGYSRPRLLLASIMAAAALSFSARASIMAAGFAVTVALVLYRHRDWRTFALLAIMAVGLVIAAVAAWAWNAEYWELVARTVFLDPAQLFPTVTLTQRLLYPDRAPLVGLIVLAIGIAIVALRRRVRSERAWIIICACTTQLALIVADPSPFTYVYAWAAIPTVAGLGMLEDLGGKRSNAWVAAAGATLAASLAALILAYVVVKGRQPPAGSVLRLVLDEPMDRGRIERLPTQELVRIMVSGEGQHSLANQLMVRRELCRRIDGQVLTVFPYHPICLPDAAYHWYEVQWPGAFAGGSRADQERFAALMRRSRPSLFIWSGPGAPRTLSPAAERAITSYRKADGFALKP